MRRDIRELRSFYATALGQVVRATVVRQLVAAWGDAHGLDVLGIGYASPFLDVFRPSARRVLAAMPEGQGVETWPAGERNLACLVEDGALPFPGAMFDRVLVVHGLEECDDVYHLLAEAHRVLAPSGRIILAAVNRRGLWAGAEATPFGHGRPFTRSQLEHAIREVELEPTAWSRALYMPPWPVLAPYGELIEQTLVHLAAPLSGLILLEAVKQTFAVKPRGARSRVPARALRPAVALPAASNVALGKTEILRHSMAAQGNSSVHQRISRR